MENVLANLLLDSINIIEDVDFLLARCLARDRHILDNVLSDILMDEYQDGRASLGTVAYVATSLGMRLVPTKYINPGWVPITVDRISDVTR